MGAGHNKEITKRSAMRKRPSPFYLAEGRPINHGQPLRPTPQGDKESRASAGSYKKAQMGQIERERERGDGETSNDRIAGWDK